MSLDAMTSAADTTGASLILHVITGLDVGGAELTLKKLILDDPHAGARHHVVSLRDVGPVGRELQVAGVTVHALGMVRGIPSPFAFIRLVRLITKLKPSVVQTWLYHADLLGGLAARCAGRRQVVWGIRCTHLPSNAPRTTRAVVRVCAWLSSRVPRVIVCCAEAARILHIGLGYSESRMRVIPNGFTLPDLKDATVTRSEMRHELGYADSDVVVGIVARFDALKNHQGFVEAAGIVARSHPEALFLLVGRGVNRENVELMRWIEQTDCTDRFLLLGERRDVERCLAAMDIFCLSSLHEGFPNVVAEAMSMRLPCVVTDAGDAARIVGDTGWVVPPGDSASLAAALARALDVGASERQRLGLAARRRVESEFSITTMRQSFEAAYADAVAGAART